MLGYDIGPFGLLFAVAVIGTAIFFGLKLHRSQQAKKPHDPRP